ncbi:MAG: UbiX family flavin prenyltransferase [Alphaproteobacteria bacterium]|nr:UbiX family flavin prenyltransferase [Alphaproteobacteria bacterium]MCZ6494620.1 UbiX family flavin prenyltransferase [Alphaproteobacteria bacterium]MCZ6813581.1 UbiX family flavin prenyltransferase [Alphaproteobacteria bacterium]MCZ6847970.1 UbiX family flavin prenyltransferase [Alphaproteobacteria bacterium]
MRRLVVGMSGASGAIYGIRLLEVLNKVDDIEVHLVLSPSSGRTIHDETDWKVSDVEALADVVYNYQDIGASLSSGSYRHAGMIIAPCSVKTLSGIVNSYDDNLLVRAADVALKEKRRVVLLVRETPLHLGHLELMARAARYGAVVMPPVPAFYIRPKSLDDVINQSVGKALDFFDISHTLFRRWKETEPSED